MLRKTLIALTMAGAMAGMPAAYADHMCQSPMCHCNMDKTKMYDQLKLDDAQRAKMKTIKEDMRMQMKASHEQMKAIRMQMQKLVTSDNLDQAMVDKLAGEKAELMKSMMKTRIMAKNKMYNVLNPQQKEMMKKMMDEMHQKMMEQRKKMMSY